MTGGILPNGGCRFLQEQPQKTLSVEIRLHRDCDSRWVADGVSEVSLFGIVVYMTHNCRYGVMVPQWLAKPSNRNVVQVQILLSALVHDDIPCFTTL